MSDGTITISLKLRLPGRITDAQNTINYGWRADTEVVLMQLTCTRDEAVKIKERFVQYNPQLTVEAGLLSVKWTGSVEV
jgi:hypothetical protein